MKKINMLLGGCLIWITLLACGDSGNANQNQNQTDVVKEEKTNPKPDKQVKKVIEIELIAQGESMNEISFEPKILTIPENSTIKLTFINKSEAAGMFHNFVLVEQGSGQEVATEGISAGKENNFVPENNENLIAYSPIADMGETLEIEFEAPPKGSYHYICTYPGHYPAMIGRLIVE